MNSQNIVIGAALAVALGSGAAAAQQSGSSTSGSSTSSGSSDRDSTQRSDSTSKGGGGASKSQRLRHWSAAAGGIGSHDLVVLLAVSQARHRFENAGRTGGVLFLSLLKHGMTRVN
jgi:hypothetical protein